MGALNDLLKNRCNLKLELVFCPYHWTYVLKEFSSGGAHKGWRYSQGVIHNTSYGVNVETGHYTKTFHQLDQGVLFQKGRKTCIIFRMNHHLCLDK